MKIGSALSEYFLGTESREMFDAQRNYYRDRLEGERLEAGLRWLKRQECKYMILARHTPNLISS